jgi:hypothetical protein
VIVAGATESYNTKCSSSSTAISCVTGQTELTGFRILTAKSELERTIVRPNLRQEVNGRIHEMYNMANIRTWHNLSIINEVFTNIYLT